MCENNNCFLINCYVIVNLVTCIQDFSFSFCRSMSKHVDSHSLTTDSLHDERSTYTPNKKAKYHPSLLILLEGGWYICFTIKNESDSSTMTFGFLYQYSKIMSVQLTNTDRLLQSLLTHYRRPDDTISAG